MTADIAHDLRTPLTYDRRLYRIHADGVLDPTPERLALIYSEIERLQNLVGDLRMLTQADAGRAGPAPAAYRPAGLLEHAALTSEHRAASKVSALEAGCAAKIYPTCTSTRLA